ncbi:MAG: hypothetical protein ABI200_01555, partial [Gaiellales bacterium]
MLKAGLFMYQPAPPTPSTVQRQPSMADVWNEFPDVHGQFVGTMAMHVTAQAPEMPHPGIVIDPAALVVSTAPARGYVEPLSWRLIKHCVQLALVASALLLVLEGGTVPLMALSYAGTSLLLMAV